VIIFMGSAAAASTLSSALDRVAAVVLASLAGQLVYVLFGWPTIQSKIATVICVFFLVEACMFVAYSGGSNAAIGTRLAATIMLFACKWSSIKGATYQSYSDNFHGLYDIVFGVGFITIVDMIFGDPPASGRAVVGLKSAIRDYLELLKEYLTSDMGSDECCKRVAAILDEISAARDLSSTAVAEPNLWRQPWHPVCFDKMCATFTGACNQLDNLARQADREKGILSKFQSYGAICNELIRAATITARVTNCVLNHSPNDDEGEKEYYDRTLAATPGQYNFPSLDKFTKEMSDQFGKSGGHFNTKENSGECRATRWNVITVTLESMMRILQEGQHTIVGSKNT